MKTKPFVSAVAGALMLTKRLQFPDQHAYDLTPGTKCMPLPSVFFCLLSREIVSGTIRVSGWVFICLFLGGGFWDEDETFSERR